MNITGIIAEYNPFHNGHAYQIERARKETDADYVIVVMSGNFVQRGACALLDKSARAKMALLNGADLVLELPPLWSCASAEYFAAAGVSLLGQLGCVNSLCFGCETVNTGLSAKICQILCSESAAYKQVLTGLLKHGTGYASAREQAVLSMLPPEDHEAAAAFLQTPNNILALEYQKAIAAYAPSITPHPVRRTGQPYHSKDLAGAFASASAIRSFFFLSDSRKTEMEVSGQNEFFHKNRIADSTPKQAMPKNAYRLLSDYKNHFPFLYTDDSSQMLHYCLLAHSAEGFSAYADCTDDFSNKICRHMDDFTSFSDFCRTLKSKDMAYTRISRILMHILLNIRQSDYTLWKKRFFIPYARILGFSRKSADLLAHLKKCTSIPLLTRAIDAGKILADKDSYAFFEKNLFADSIYRALVTEKGGQAMPNEYRRQIIITEK